MNDTYGEDLCPTTIMTPEVKELLGVEVGSYTGEVEKVMVRRYAEASGDANPLYVNEAYAKGSRYGSIIAPPPSPSCSVKFMYENRAFGTGTVQWDHFIVDRIGRLQALRHDSDGWACEQETW